MSEHGTLIHLDLSGELADGIYEVQSESTTRYLLVIGWRSRPWLARMSGPRSTLRLWWDNDLQPLCSVTAMDPMDSDKRDSLQIRVGWRHIWVVDPEGPMGTHDWWAVSRTCIPIVWHPLDQLDALMRSWDD